MRAIAWRTSSSVSRGSASTSYCRPRIRVNLIAATSTPRRTEPDSTVRPLCHVSTPRKGEIRRSPAGEPAAVDDERRPGDVAGVRRGQPGDGGGDLLRRRDPAQRTGGARAGDALRGVLAELGELLAQKRRIGVARADAVGADAVGPVVDGDGARHV